MHAPGCSVLYLEIKDDVTLTSELEDFIEGWNSLADKLTVEPQTDVESPEFREGAILHSPATIGCSLQSVVMNSDEPSIASQMQVGFYETGSQLHGPLKSGHGVFWRIARGPTMGNDPGRAHERHILADLIEHPLGAPRSFARTANSKRGLERGTRTGNRRQLRPSQMCKMIPR